MQYKQYLKYFVVIAIIVIAFLPSYNFYQYAKKYDCKKLFNTDGVEKYVNYFVYKVFNRSMEQDKVVVGKDGFLFLGNKFSKIVHKTNGTLQLSQKEIDIWTDKLIDLQQWYEDQGIKFIILLAPNKHAIYKEKLPNWMEYSGQTMTDNILDSAKKKNIHILDLRPILSKHKKDGLLYFKTDTHWNKKGAYIAFNATLDFLNTLYDTTFQKPHLSLQKIDNASGDLARFLKIPSLLGDHYEIEYQYDFYQNFNLCRGVIDKNSGNLKICKKVENPIIGITRAPQYTINRSVPTNKLLLICDSFASQSSQLYNATFNIIWRWHYNHLHGDKLFHFVKKNPPDIVIYQLAQRDFNTNLIVSNSFSPITKIDIKNSIIKRTIFNFDDINASYSSNHRFQIDKIKEYMNLDVIHRDPSIQLNHLKTQMKNVVLSYEIVSPNNTFFQIFYKESKESQYSETNSYKVPLKKGSNSINLLIPAKYINNILRVDLVAASGNYQLKHFKIYTLQEDRKDEK